MSLSHNSQALSVYSGVERTRHDKRLWDRWETYAVGSTDGATGVKQLSALAAPGGEDVIEPGRLFKQPLSARQHKARGVIRSPRAAMEAICLDVTVQQVSPGWGISKHLTHPKKKEKRYSTTGLIWGMSTTHGHSVSTHTSQQSRVYPFSTPRSHCSACFERGEGRPPLESRKCWGKKRKDGRKGVEKQPRPPWLRCSMIVFV